MNLAFIKKKKFYIPAIIIILIVGYSFVSASRNKKGPEYQTTNVAREDLRQTVETTGNIESANDLDLHFELSGTLTDLRVKEGDKVKVGQWLANLRLAELNASIAQASANLQQKLAGVNESELAYYKAAVDLSEADLNNTKSSTENSIKVAEAAVQTAENNLKKAEGGETSQIVEDEYKDALAVLQTSIAAADNGLTQADNILGIDNTLSNDSFDDYLAILDSSKLGAANGYYLTVKASRDELRSKVGLASNPQNHLAIDDALQSANKALSQLNTLLGSVNEVLAATPPVGSLTQASLDTLKSTINTTRTSVNTQYSAVITEVQAVANAKNSLTTYTIAYNKSLQDLENARKTAEATVAIKKAGYDQAVANYNNKKNPPRAVDVASYRAAVAQAVANRDKAVMRAPVDGVVGKVNKKKGELVMSSEVVMKVVAPHYEVKVDVPETDVAKLALNDNAEITLDAFGDDTKFKGTVISIDRASTEIQDVVYYRVKVAMEDSDKEIKSGMTANVNILTEERSGVLTVPTRAVLSRDNGDKYVRILENNELKEITVKTGLRADDGKMEILEGVNEGATIVVSVKEAK